MKEKIKKAFEGVTYDLVFARVFIAIFGYLVFAVWSIIDFATLSFIIPFLLIALQCFELHSLKKERRKDMELFIMACKLKDLARAMAEDFAYDLKRYKNLYGELPKEEETEKNKETKKE